MAVRTVAMWARATSDANATSVTDRELLRRYAVARDEGAFAILVSRHARMVLGICRRLLSTVQDAEDATQATFLVLARKAGTQRWQPSAANWLYTTARRIAAKARRAAGRRVKREGKAAVPEAVPAIDSISATELLSILDEEMEKLQARYREPIVLCYLEGLSREEAAARLGVPQGTVKTRLERGRRQLEASLARRGVEVGICLLALSVASPARASAPQLVESILSAVSGPTPAVAALAKGVLVNTTFHQALVMVVAAVVTGGLGIGLLASGPAAESADRTPNGPTLILGPATRPAAVTPVPQAVLQAELKFQKDVAVAREKAIDFLKKQQKDGIWEGQVLNLMANMDGGVTGLVTLSLLEAGVPANDPALAKAIEYLAKLEPKKTYVVSLQTQVLARADAKKYKEPIQKNVDWLLKEAIQENDKLAGWSYPGNIMADNSNTHFAVMALHAAASAGAKIDAKVWVQIREFYTRTQIRYGGWGYYPREDSVDPRTFSMTTCGLLGLTIADQHDKNAKEPAPAIKKGMASLLNLNSSGRNEAYEWLASAELGRLLGTTEFKAGEKSRAWFKEGAEKLIKEQKKDGSWQGKSGLDREPFYTTACALYFLGAPRKP